MALPNFESKFADLSKELGLGSVKNGRSISKRAPGPDYRPDSLILRSESDISIFCIRFRTPKMKLVPGEKRGHVPGEKKALLEGSPG